MIKLAIVGLGRIGKVHLKNCIFSLPEVQVVAACSRSEQSLNFAKNLGVKALYTSIDDLFKEVDFDTVIIASPTAFHFEHLQKAIAHKKHIFCEKPIDLSLANTQLLIKQLEKQPVKFMLGFNRRFDPSILKIKNEISKGKQGKIHSIRLISRDPGPPPMEFLKTSGGLFLDMAIHDFDLARALMESEVTEVYSTAGIFGNLPLKSIDDVDTAITVLKFKNKALATVENSRNSTYGYDQRLEVFCETGMWSNANQLENSILHADAHGAHQPKPIGFFIERYQTSFLKALDYFVSCLLKNRAPNVSFDEGLASLKISLAAQKSSKENRVVSLDEIN